MATNKKQEELRKRAIRNLAESREEIGAEIRKLRRELSPKVVMHNAVAHHKGAIVGIAIGATVVTTALIYRSVHAERPKSRHPGSRDFKRTASSGMIPHMLRLCAGTLIPVLLKSAVMDRMLQSLIRPTRSPQRADTVNG